MTIDDIETPAVVIDEAIARRNIEQFQTYCSKHGLELRPHIKTHKLPHFAKMQIEFGAIGINCQKVSEAEVMADHGMEDILITYNILGSAKLSRLRRLSDRVARLSVTADSQIVVAGLANTFADSEKPLRVLIECDTGAHRCGVSTPEQALRLALSVSQSPGLAFAGLMTYPAVGGGASVASFMAKARKFLGDAGLDCPTVSSGGSPDMWTAGEVAGVSEYRIGTYIYNDRSLVERGVCTWQDCALTVLTTVVSTPSSDRAIIDAGSKTLTSDLLGLDGYGQVMGHDKIQIAMLSEEHGTLKISGDESLQVGERIRVVPNHACVVSNLVDYVWIQNQRGLVSMYQVAARGCIT